MKYLLCSRTSGKKDGHTHLKHQNSTVGVSLVMTDGGHVHHTADWRREGGNQGGSQYLSTQWDAVAAAVVCALTTCLWDCPTGCVSFSSCFLPCKQRRMCVCPFYTESAIHKTCGINEELWPCLRIVIPYLGARASGPCRM